MTHLITLYYSWNVYLVVWHDSPRFGLVYFQFPIDCQ